MAVLNDVYQVKVFTRNIQAGVQQTVAVNIMHYRVGLVSGTGPTDFQIAAAMDGVWGPAMINVIPILCQYYGTSIQKIFPLPIVERVINIASRNVGARVLEMGAPQLTGMITKTTGLAGRKFRGRFYVPFPAEDDNLTGTPEAAYLGLLGPLANTIFTGIVAGLPPNTAPLFPCLFRTGAPPNTTDLTGATVRPYFGTQRRRGQASGPDVVPF